MTATLTIDGNTFTVACEHHTRTDHRTHDPTISESDEMMIRYTLQRHSSYCERACTLALWNEWFERRRQRFLAQGNERAHG